MDGFIDGYYEGRVMSLASTISNGNESSAADLLPGFNPQAIGGEKKLYGTYSPQENPGITAEAAMGIILKDAGQSRLATTDEVAEAVVDFASPLNTETGATRLIMGEPVA